MDAPVKKGDILAEKYEVDEVLGIGGMGVVVAARHTTLGQKVALKFMLPAAAEQANAADRFLREARAAVRLRSEHVARVLDVGKLENGSPYMVMEFLEGKDLGGVLDEDGPISVIDAVGYVMQACAAIAEAHSQSIVHRDLKPENLFLTFRPDGRPLVKVLDFGISKILDGSTDLSATKTGMAMGSPAYMAPEQMRSAKHADARADIWSLGALLFQLLSGQLPFHAETFTEMMAKVLTEPPRLLTDMSPDVPPGLAQVIGMCLEKDISKRVQSVPQLVSLLAPFAGNEGQLIAKSLGLPAPEVVNTRPSAPTSLYAQAAGETDEPGTLKTQRPEMTGVGPGQLVQMATPMPGYLTPVPGQMIATPPPGHMPGMVGTPVPGQMMVTPIPGPMPGTWGPGVVSTETAASGEMSFARQGAGRGKAAIFVLGAVVAAIVVVAVVFGGGPAADGEGSDVNAATAPATDPAGTVPLVAPPVAPADAGVRAAVVADAAAPAVPDAAPVVVQVPDAGVIKKRPRRPKRPRGNDNGLFNTTR